MNIQGTYRKSDIYIYRYLHLLSALLYVIERISEMETFEQGAFERRDQCFV